MKRPFFRSKSAAVVTGLGLFLAGSWCLWDAWEGRGEETPRILRPFTWW